MAAPIGVSPSDIASGIILVRNLIKAFDENTGASAAYKGLVNELRNLKRALKAVNDLKVDEKFRSQKLAAEQAAVQCQVVIEDFVRKNAKYIRIIQHTV